MTEDRSPGGGITLEEALVQAEEHMAGLRDLYGRLRIEGHAFAYASAHAAADRADELVQQLREDLLAQAVNAAVQPDPGNGA